MVEKATCYKCECGNVYWTHEHAEACCAPKYCEDCGEEVPKYRIRCEWCGKKRQYEKAEKVTEKEWNGWVFFDGTGYMDGYFRDIGELVECCEDEGILVPEWVFACKKIQHKLDIDTALEYMTEDAYEDAFGDLRCVDDLRDYAHRWNKKQNVVSYYPDYSKVVLLQQCPEGRGNDGADKLVER